MELYGVNFLPPQFILLILCKDVSVESHAAMDTACAAASAAAGAAAGTAAAGEAAKTNFQ
jgi:hypothetical protein